MAQPADTIATAYIESGLTLQFEQKTYLHNTSAVWECFLFLFFTYSKNVHRIYRFQVLNYFQDYVYYVQV